MKRLLAILLLLGNAFILMQGQSQTTVVKGKIIGLESGQLYMLSVVGENVIDTLGTTFFNSPNFEIKAPLKEPMPVQIVVAGYQGGFTLLAEPGVHYEALLTNGNDAYIRGGQLHDAWESHKRHSDSLWVEIRRLRNRYETLKNENKFRSASVTNDSLRFLEKKVHDDTQAFLASHDDLITAYTMQVNAVMRESGLEESLRMYNSMGPVARTSLSGRLMKERIDRLTKTAEGLKAPDFTLRDLDGNEVTLSKIKGKVKIVDFWASWCGPCRLNNPALKSLYDEFHSKGLEIVSISLDDKPMRWKSAVDKDGLNWINVSSLKGWKCDVAQLYNVTAVPAIFVLDQYDRIIAKNIRGAKLKELVQQRLK